MLSLVRSANALGHDVAVAAAPGPLSKEVTCPVYSLPILDRRPARVPAGILALEQARRSFRPDLLHCHNPGMALIGSPVGLGGRRVPGLVT
ncbi:MAG: glycosyltransferase family 4 protein, partial [Acidimicrobiales bacterium]